MFEIAVIGFSISIILILIITVPPWGGKCKKCKSFNNWYHKKESSLKNYPNTLEIAHGFLCKKCGYFDFKSRKTFRRLSKKQK